MICEQLEKTKYIVIMLRRLNFCYNLEDSYIKLDKRASHPHLYTLLVVPVMNLVIQQQ